MRKSKLFAFLLASLVLVYTGCSEKETPQPVEDTERTDALRQELRELQLQVLGVELDNDFIAGQNASLEEEIAALEAAIVDLETSYSQQTTYSVQVFDFQGKVIAGASVTVNENGTIATKTTNANGTAVFERVRAGAVVGVVSASGFATANYQASLYNSADDAFGATTRIALLPKGGNAQADAGLFTVKGYLYANQNAVDDTVGGYIDNYGPIANYSGIIYEKRGPNTSYRHRSYTAVATKMTGILHLDLDYVPFTNDTWDGNGSETSNDGNAQVMRIAYEDATYEATFDATTKQYSIKLPAFSDFMASYFGNNPYFEWADDMGNYPYADEWATQWYYTFTFGEFTADATLIDDVKDNNNNSVTFNDDYQSQQYNSYYGWTYEYWKVIADMQYNPATLKTFTRKYNYRIDDEEDWNTYDFDVDGNMQALPGKTYQPEWSNFFYTPYRFF